MDIFLPDVYAKSIYSINYNKLQENGIKCLLFDLDNTIAPKGVLEPDKKVIELFESLEDMGFKVIIVSNGPKHRVRPFKEKLNIDAAHSSFKPLKTKYKKIMKMYKFNEHEIAGIGDQLLTDVCGANRMGITSVLINQISKIDFKITKMNRVIEDKIFKHLEKKGLFKIGEYYD